MAEKAAKPAKKTARKPRQKVDIDKLALTLPQEFQKKHKAYQELAGDKELGNKQFYTWYLKQPNVKANTAGVTEDANAKLVSGALTKLKQEKTSFRIPQGGYVIKTGRKPKGSKDTDPTPYIVEPAKKKK